MKLADCSIQRAEVLYEEITKVRCWLTGYMAGRTKPGELAVGPPGEDSLRQMQILLRESIARERKKEKKK